MNIFVRPDGGVEAVHRDELVSVLRELGGKVHLERASQVEPQQTGGEWKWTAVECKSGVWIGEYASRREAIEAEVEYLEQQMRGN